MSIKMGKGAFVFPPVSILSSASQQLLPLPGPNEREIFYSMTWINSRASLIATDDGFVGIIDYQADKLLDFLNVIFATCLTWGIQTEQIRDFDLVGFRWDQGTSVIQLITHNPLSIHARVALDRDDPATASNWSTYPRGSLQISNLPEILERSVQYVSNDFLKENLIVLADGWSLLFRKTNKPAFLLGWIVIERMLSDSWKSFVSSLGRTSSERDALLDNRSYPASNRIETLAFASKMTDAARIKLNGLRKKRNDIVHNNADISPEEVRDCLQVGKNLIFNRIHNPQDPFGNI